MAEIYTRKNAFIMAYVRRPDKDSYPDGLARSIHFSHSKDGKNFEAMNQNYGILFAKAKVLENNTLCPMCADKPQISILKNREYLISAIPVQENGTDDPECIGMRICWKTKDFIEFEELGILTQEQLEQICQKDAAEDPRIEETKKRMLPEGAVPGGIIEVSVDLCDRAVLHWSRIDSIAAKVPSQVTASCAEDVESVEATILYSDGSAARKRVKWNLEAIDFETPGIQKITGEIESPHYPFPLARGFGDPVIFPWEGRYYYISTTDFRKNIGFYVREADTVSGLFAEGVKEHLILDRNEEKGFIQTFWAPEFHVIGGELYILFAISGKVFGPQCHLMKWKKGRSLIEADSWEEPIRIQRKNGRPLAEDGITLDMTYVKTGECSYMIWSYRQHIGTELDTGSQLYIATVDEAEPWKLTSEPVLLTRPLYGWENVNQTINNEGPYAFQTNGKIYLTYSGGDAGGYTYALGLMTAEEESDLLNINSWKKRGTPVLTFYSVDGEYGPGHNSFFTDDHGDLLIAYHAETAIDNNIRCNGIRRVHFNIHGEPVFDLSAERDLDPGLKKVEMNVIVGSV